MINLAGNKTFQSRIVHKHDTEENWLKATNFIPLQGEIIIYDIDDNYSYERFKIGDGTTNVNSLPFVINIIPITNEQIDEICGAGTSPVLGEGVLGEMIL